MKTTKNSRRSRMLMLLLAVILCIGMMPGAAFAADETGTDPVIYVGGVQVTSENASDIFGDGTASYDFEWNTLTLNGAAMTRHYSLKDDQNAGIYSSGDLYIELAEGTTNTVSVKGNKNTYGIYCKGQLSIFGAGKLDVTAGSNAVALAETGESPDNFGIYARGELTISEAAVTAQAGDLSAAKSAVPEMLFSAGVYLKSDLSIDFGGSLTAIGGKVTGGDYAISTGVYINCNNSEYYGNAAVYEGTLEASGAAATGTHYAESTGVALFNCGLYTYDKAAVVTLKGDTATASDDAEQGAMSNGIYTAAGDVGFDGGTITITAGKVSGNLATSRGIYAYSDEDSDGTLTGGSVSVYGTRGVKVTVSAESHAILAQAGIDMDSTVVISSPEGCVIADELFGTRTYFCIADAEGNVSGDVTFVTDETEALKANVDAVLLIARSEMSSAKGKKAVKLSWYDAFGEDLSFLEGYEVFRSTKRYKGYTTKPIFDTARDTYWNTDVKAGQKYFYKVRGYVTIDGEKYYTGWSQKAWRTVK